MWLHCIMEFICGMLGVVVFSLSYPLYLKNKDFTSLYWFSMWGLWMSILTYTHIIVGIFSNNPDVWIPFSTLPERVGDSILLMLCVYPGQSKEIKIYGLKKKVWIFGIFCAFFIASVVFGAYTSLDALKEGLFGRPQAVIPLCIACFVFGRIIDTTSAWGKILKVGILSSIINSAIMLFSHKLYDWQFNMAHGFKIVSYFFMLYAIAYLLNSVCKNTNGGCSLFKILKG